MSRFASLSLSSLAALYNNAIGGLELKNETKVAKFKDRKSAERRLDGLMERNELCLRKVNGVPMLLREDDLGDVSGVVELMGDAPAVADEDETTNVEQAFGEGEVQPPNTGDLVSHDPALSPAVVPGPVGEGEVGPEESKENIEDVLPEPEAPKVKRGGKNPGAGRRVPTVNRAPRKASEIAQCREGTNQALLLDLLWKGTTMERAANHINSLLGKKLSEGVVYSTMLYDLCTVKGYGVRAESLNGEALFKAGLVADAADLKFRDGQPQEGYDPEAGKTVYFLVLPEGMKVPLDHMPRKSATKAA